MNVFVRTHSKIKISSTVVTQNLCRVPRSCSSVDHTVKHTHVHVRGHDETTTPPLPLLPTSYQSLLIYFIELGYLWHKSQSVFDSITKFRRDQFFRHSLSLCFVKTFGPFTTLHVKIVHLHARKPQTVIKIVIRISPTRCVQIETCIVYKLDST